MTLSEEFKYDAFVSYRRSDGTATARWLRQRLLQYRAPKPLSTDYGVKLRVYLDTIYERATYDFFKKNIKPSLAQSKHLIVICTPDALKARADGTPNWVTREVEYFMSLPQGSNIIPVLARTAEALPHAIRDAYANIEVIDLRLYSHTSWLFPGRTQYLNDELLKIIAALMVVPDEQVPTLRREESRRRQARLRLFAAVGVGLLSVVTILALWATLSLVQATRQLVQNHTLQGQGLFDETPSAARLHFAQAVKTAGSFGLRRIGLSIDNRLARLWLGQYRKTSPPVIHWHDAAVTAAALSADGLDSCHRDFERTYHGLEHPNGQQSASLSITEPTSNALYFLQTRTTVASAGRDNRARVWWVPSGEPVERPLPMKTT